MYKNNGDVKYVCRHLMARSLLPEPVIEDTYDELVRHLSTETMKNNKWFIRIFPKTMVSKSAHSEKIKEIYRIFQGYDFYPSLEPLKQFWTRKKCVAEGARTILIP